MARYSGTPSRFVPGGPCPLPAPGGGRCGPGREPTSDPEAATRGALACRWGSPGLLESLGPSRPPSPGLRGPWVSMATSGARPGGGQPGWGRGALGASAAAWPCSPPWPPCSPSRCPPRCRGETRVKYLRAALPPLSLVGQLAPPAPPARAPGRVLRARTTFCFPFPELVSVVLRL